MEGRADVVCMGCEADLLFNEMFQGGQRNPFTPHQFLYGCLPPSSSGLLVSLKLSDTKVYEP